MDEETKQKLKEAGREDLIEIFEINQSGYAGVLSNGNIVDRRIFPEAIAVQKNSMFGIPEPKDLIGMEAGETCNRDGCKGVIALKDKDPCYCHIIAPCSSCCQNYEYCPECGYEPDQP